MPKAKKRPPVPKAAQAYMDEYGDSEVEFRRWLREQKQFYQTLSDRSGSTLASWLAFKMTCTVSAAQVVLRWAGLEGDTPST
jgi:hypothetical protein